MTPKKTMKYQLKSERLKISFEKSLISHANLFNFFAKTRSQAILEYFILFTIIALLTIIGVSTFFPKVQGSLNAMQSAAVDSIVSAGNSGN